LWRDRAPEQAAGSLRHALVDLRKALCDHADVLMADRDWISLRKGSADIIASEEAGEFLDGIAVRDSGFEAWRAQHPLNARRPAQTANLDLPTWLHQPTKVSDTPLLIGWGTACVPGTGSAMVAEMIASRIASNVAEQVTSWTMAVSRDQIVPATPPDIDVTCNVIEDNGICLAFIKIVHVASGRVLFARDCRFVGTAASLIGSEAISRTAFEAAEKAVGFIPYVMGASRPVTRSTALGQLALHKMFSFDSDHLAEADSLLAQAYETHESSVFLAWRGLLQMIKSIELTKTGSDEIRDMAASLTSDAIQRNPSNATVNALVSQTRAMLFGDVNAAMHSASQALEENPRHPLALQAMAVAKVLAGEDEEAYRLSTMARSYASKSAFRHWWDAHHCTTCVATGRTDEAIRAAEAALASVPSFRPAYRYLVALYANRDDLERADQMKRRLETVEPGFTLERMLNDPDYPVRTLRRTGLITAVRRLL
jgi:tetratricopeptide (TPR) repeat protein